MSNAVIIGQRRQGKTTLAVAFANLKSNTIIIWDPNAQCLSPAFQTIRPDQLAAWIENCDPDEINIARLGPFDESDIIDQFEIACEQLWDFQGYSFIIDETSMLQMPQRITPGLSRFLRRSDASTWVIQTSHRLYELHPLTRTLCDDLLIFNTQNKRERDFLDANFKEGMGDLVKELGDREFLHWYRRTAGAVEHRRRPDSTIWYIDLRNSNRRLHADYDDADQSPEQARKSTGSALKGEPAAAAASDAAAAGNGPGGSGPGGSESSGPGGT